MASKMIGADVNFAWPQAEIAVMGASGAINILYRKASGGGEKRRAVEAYEEEFSNPYRAAERGLVDEIIMPRDTRRKLIRALEMARNKIKAIRPRSTAICVITSKPLHPLLGCRGF